jgi:hypothetical protein
MSSQCVDRLVRAEFPGQEGNHSVKDNTRGDRPTQHSVGNTTQYLLKVDLYGNFTQETNHSAVNTDQAEQSSISTSCVNQAGTCANV